MHFMRYLALILCGLFCKVGIIFGQLPCDAGADLTLMLDNSADVTTANFELIRNSFIEFTDPAHLQISTATVRMQAILSHRLWGYCFYQIWRLDRRTSEKGCPG